MKILSLSLLVIFALVGCGKSNNSNSHPAPAAPAQSTAQTAALPIPQPSVSPAPPQPNSPQDQAQVKTAEEATAEAQKTLDEALKAKLEAQDAQAQAEQAQKDQEAAAAKMKTELDAASHYEESALTPEQKASADLLAGKPIVFLYRVWSESEDNLNLFRNKLRSVDVTHSVDRHFRTDYNTNNQWVGRFLVALDSNVKFKEVGDYLHTLQLGWMSPTPVTRAFVRTKMTVWFNKGGLAWTGVKGTSETFSVGDTKPFPLTADQLQASKGNGVDVALFTQEFQSCGDITPQCLDSLRSQPYIFQTKEIQNTTARPWDWLKDKLTETMKTIDGRKTLFTSSITNISLEHRLYIATSDQSTGYDVKSIFTPLNQRELVDDSGAIEAPININSSGISEYILSQPYRFQSRLSELSSFMANTPGEPPKISSAGAQP